MFSGKVHNLRHFGLGHFISIDPALADTVVMHMQHNSRRGLVILAEEPLQHVGHEFHRRVVVVENEHAVQVRPLGLRLGLGDDRGAGAARTAGVAFALAIVVRHAGGTGGQRTIAWFHLGAGHIVCNEAHGLADVILEGPGGRAGTRPSSS